MPLTLPGPLDLPLLVLEIFSLAIILRICGRLYKASSYAFDDRSVLLFSGFLLLALSLLLSVASIFIDDLFIFSSLTLFSIYASLAGYFSILSARLLKESMLPAIAPLA